MRHRLYQSFLTLLPILILFGVEWCSQHFFDHHLYRPLIVLLVVVGTIIGDLLISMVLQFLFAQTFLTILSFALIPAGMLLLMPSITNDLIGFGVLLFSVTLSEYLHKKVN